MRLQRRVGRGRGSAARRLEARCSLGAPSACAQPLPGAERQDAEGRQRPGRPGSSRASALTSATAVPSPPAARTRARARAACASHASISCADLGQPHARAGQGARDLHGHAPAAALGVRVHEDREPRPRRPRALRRRPDRGVGARVAPSKAALQDVGARRSSARRVRACPRAAYGVGSIFAWIVTRTWAPPCDSTPLAASTSRVPLSVTGRMGRPRLERQVERALLERQELAGPAARALGRDPHVRPAGEQVARALEARDGARGGCSGRWR